MKEREHCVSLERRLDQSAVVVARFSVARVESDVNDDKFFPNGRACTMTPRDCFGLLAFFSVVFWRFSSSARSANIGRATPGAYGEWSKNTYIYQLVKNYFRVGAPCAFGSELKNVVAPKNVSLGVYDNFARRSELRGLKGRLRDGDGA